MNQPPESLQGKSFQFRSYGETASYLHGLTLSLADTRASECDPANGLPCAPRKGGDSAEIHDKSDEAVH